MKDTGQKTAEGLPIYELFMNGKLKLVTKDEKGNLNDAPDKLTDDPEAYCHVDYSAGNTEFKETSAKLIKLGRGNVLGIHTYKNIKDGNIGAATKCIAVINWKPVASKQTWMPSNKYGGYGKLNMPVEKFKEILPELNNLVK